MRFVSTPDFWEMQKRQGYERQTAEAMSSAMGPVFNLVPLHGAVPQEFCTEFQITSCPGCSCQTYERVDLQVRSGKAGRRGLAARGSAG